MANISPTRKALHWLKITERIEYKVASLTYNALQFHQPSYISDLLTVQSNSHSTRTSSLLTLKRPTVVRAAISKRLFCHFAPVLWSGIHYHHVFVNHLKIEATSLVFPVRISWRISKRSSSPNHSLHSLPAHSAPSMESTISSMICWMWIGLYLVAVSAKSCLQLIRHFKYRLTYLLT